MVFFAINIGGGNKKARVDDDEDGPGTFEERLASMEEMEMDMGEEEDFLKAEGEGPQQESTYDRWASLFNYELYIFCLISKIKFLALRKHHHT